MRKIAFFILLILPLIATRQAIAQQAKVIADSVIIAPENVATGTPFSLRMPAGFALPLRVDAAKFWVKLDFGDQLLQQEFTESPSVTFIPRALSANVEVPYIFEGQEYTLSVDYNEPEAYFAMDMTEFIASNSGEGLVFDEIAIEITDHNFSTLPSALSSDLRFQLHYENTYAFDPASVTPVVQSIENISTASKTLRFTWQGHSLIEHYQLQLLRLYNTQEGNTSDESIATEVSWEKATVIEGTAHLVEGTDDQYYFDLTIAEGTGFYVFRVRAVNDYEEGGMGNDRNWGPWGTAPDEGAALTLSYDGTNAPDLPYFYFVDLEDGRNWSFSRIFTENNRIKETVTYANTLQQVRQNITYLPSEEVTLITHTVLDNTGRPALVTLPIPVDGKDISYHEQFIKSSTSSQLYQAADYDNDDNFLSPTTVADGGAVDYYKDNPEHVANAQGYPFTRTIFYNDGLGRVKEESGVGLDHRIGSDHTTRYLYGTASEDELLALFGEEAPQNQNVFKTITIDPNNVASISYTNKEGQVIATGLSFLGESDALEDLDETTELSKTIQDNVTVNVKTQNGFTSSKRITLLQDVTVNISYSVLCAELEALCLVTSLDCGYKVTYQVFQVNDDNTITEIAVHEPTLPTTCVYDQGREGDYKTAENYSISLGVGTYIIQKTLEPQGLNTTVSDNTDNINDQLEPIVNQLTQWLETVEDQQQLEDFFEALRAMTTAINNATLDTFEGAAGFEATISQIFFDNTYNAEAGDNGTQLKNYYYMALDEDQETGVVHNISLTTPCCSNILIPINWVPPFDATMYDRDQNGVTDFRDVPDFEGLLFEALGPCIESEDDITEQSIREDYMFGWDKPGVFNQMVYHMLTDQYSVAFDENGVPLEPSEQYDPEELADCWETIILQLKEQICGSFSFAVDDDRSISEGYDDEYEEGEGEGATNNDNHDDTFDDGIDGMKGFFLIKWIAKKKISKRMRELQSPSSEGADDDIKPEVSFHMVEQFLNCTGYKFAKILIPIGEDGDGLPLESDNYEESNSTYSYLIETSDADETLMPLKYAEVDTDTYLTEGSQFENTVYSYSYARLSDWCPTWVDENGELDTIFVNIYNPIYAFKYFHYDYFGQYEQLERNTCFRDPNDCYKLDNLTGKYEVNDDGGLSVVPCCGAGSSDAEWATRENCYLEPAYPATGGAKWIVKEFCGQGAIYCEQDRTSWSGDQINTFYSMIASYVETPFDWNDFEDIDCSVFIDPSQRWYELKDLSEMTEAQAEQALNYPDLATEDMLTDAGIDIDTYYRLETFERADGETVTQFSLLEKEMQEIRESCLEACDDRREEFKSNLYTMFEEQCYVIGGCRTDDPSTFNVIPEEDIDVMVDAIIAECKTQCVLTTFGCRDIPCRGWITPNYEVGETENETKLELGVAGHPDPQGTGYDDEGAVVVGTDGEVDFNGDGVIDAIRYNTDGTNLSWYEYTMIQQVETWELEATLPSQCETVGDNAANCDDLATGTFVDKGTYEINPGVVTEADLGESVESPTKTLTVTAPAAEEGQ